MISGTSDPEEAVSKNLFEMKTKVEAIRDSLQRQDASELEVEECEDVIKFIEEELRYLEAECSKLCLQALIAWIIVFIVENSDCDSLWTLSVSLLASQTIEVILVVSGDVERNPGPTYLDGMFVFAAPPNTTLFSVFVRDQKMIFSNRIMCPTVLGWITIELITIYIIIIVIYMNNNFINQEKA